MHNVNLETAFMEAMDRLENHLLETQDWHEIYVADVDLTKTPVLHLE